MALFTIVDSVYGSVFYLMTGGHGLATCDNSVFLTVCWFHLLYYQFHNGDPVGSMVLAFC